MYFFDSVQLHPNQLLSASGKDDFESQLESTPYKQHVRFFGKQLRNLVADSSEYS